MCGLNRKRFLDFSIRSKDQVNEDDERDKCGEGEIYRVIGIRSHPFDPHIPLIVHTYSTPHVSGSSDPKKSWWKCKCSNIEFIQRDHTSPCTPYSATPYKARAFKTREPDHSFSCTAIKTSQDDALWARQPVLRYANIPWDWLVMR